MRLLSRDKDYIFITILWSGECEATTERASSNSCHCCYDTDIVPVGYECGYCQRGGGGGKLEGLSRLCDCHIDDVEDDDAVNLVSRRWAPCDGG